MSDVSTQILPARRRRKQHTGGFHRQPTPELIRARNLQRGGPNGNDDMFWLLIDTYNDDRNAYLFETNVFGTQDDAIITDESMSRSDWQWDGIYESEGRIADDGWHVELAIPFKTIRFDNAHELTPWVSPSCDS